MKAGSWRYRIAVMGGTLLLRRGWWRSAASLLDRAIKLVPENWEVHNNLAIALLKLERWEEAAGMAQRAIRLKPAAADSHDLFGIALLQLQRFDEAVVAYRRALTVDPARYVLHDRLGMALWRLERWDDVVETYESAVKLDAVEYGAYYRLGVALLRLGRRNDAAPALRRAMVFASKDPSAADQLAGIQMNLADAETPPAAAPASGAAVPRQVHPATMKHLTRGATLALSGQWDAAVTELVKASELSPHLGGAHFLQVDPLVRLGRFEDALAAHRRAVAAGGPMPSLPGQSAATRVAERQATCWTVENLGADVFVAERWLEQLAVGPGRVPDGPRLLFVLDNDFGELTTVQYFLLGQDLAAPATLLLPERLYQRNAEILRGRTRRYASVNDIRAAVERDRPDVIFLCSGYLLCEHLGFPADDLARLVDWLRERGCRVVTADPYLGMLSKHDPRELISIDVPTTHPELTVEQLKAAVRPDEERLWARYTLAEQTLRDTYHLYPGFCDIEPRDMAETDTRNLAFFNDRLLRPASLARPDRPHWLFILASLDCEIQSMFEGETRFADIVAGKLIETLAAGRHPILIAPPAFLDQLTPRLPTAQGIDLLPYCPFTRFLALLLSAEQVFYWNAVSHSLLIRLYNQLPIVLFDRGHLIRTAPAVHDRIVRWYYQGWTPPIRDHRTPLTVETVEGWAEEYRREAASLVERFRRAPAPAAMIADLMGRAPVPELPAGVSER